ncbi:hypothetical protein BDZ91DRAFT_372845 [Kalaharituber pfeilii]|nr:hypothetical protein BDZ91DRAFT_372845 [Kalaharituber pfeilii]
MPRPGSPGAVCPNSRCYYGWSFAFAFRLSFRAAWRLKLLSRVSRCSSGGGAVDCGIATNADVMGPFAVHSAVAPPGEKEAARYRVNNVVRHTRFDGISTWKKSWGIKRSVDNKQMSLGFCIVIYGRLCWLHPARSPDSRATQLGAQMEPYVPQSTLRALLEYGDFNYVCERLQFPAPQ